MSKLLLWLLTMLLVVLLTVLLLEGPAGMVESLSGYGGRTGIFCIVVLDREDCSELTEACVCV